MASAGAAAISVTAAAVASASGLDHRAPALAPPPLNAPPPSTTPAPAAAAQQSDLADAPVWTIAEHTPHRRPQSLTLGADVWPAYTVGGTIWYAIPVASKGIIPAVNDSVDLEFGGTVMGYFDGADHGAVIPAIGARWNFHLTQAWTPFATLKLAARFGFGQGYDPGWFDVGVSLGSLLRLQEHVALRLELGYPGGIGVGVALLVGG